MAHFNYECSKLVGGDYRILAHAGDDAPACVPALGTIYVGDVYEMESPNPIVMFRIALGLDGIEKAAEAIRAAWKEEHKAPTVTWDKYMAIPVDEHPIVLIDMDTVPTRVKQDYYKRNRNIESGEPICHKCDGTGNQLMWMHQPCSQCHGTGIA